MNKKLKGVFATAILIIVFAFGSFAPAAQAAGLEKAIAEVDFSAKIETDDEEDERDDDGSNAGSNIVDVALAANAATGEFSILIAALQAADPAVLQTLSGEGQFTVFAPTDAAFGSLLEELGVTAEQLLADQALVTQVLLYHVASGNLDSEDVLESDSIDTLQAGSLFQDDGILTDANGRTANLVSVDIAASNGVIHVIDRVVLPRSNPQPPVDNDDDDDDDAADEPADTGDDNADTTDDATDTDDEADDAVDNNTDDGTDDANNDGDRRGDEDDDDDDDDDDEDDDDDDNDDDDDDDDDDD